MSDFLRVDTVALRRASEQVAEIQSRFRASSNGIMAEVESLEGFYTGEAANAFYDRIHQDFEPISNAFDALLHNYYAFLHNTALRFELPEDEALFSVGSVRHETIFSHDHF